MAHVPKRNGGRLLTALISLIVLGVTAGCAPSTTSGELSSSSAPSQSEAVDDQGMELQLAARDYFMAAYKGDDLVAHEMMSARCRERMKGKPVPHKPTVDPAEWKYLGGFGGSKPADMTPFDSKGPAGPKLQFVREDGRWRMDSC